MHSNFGPFLSRAAPPGRPPTTAAHPPEYWQAVAKGLEAESAKASVYVTHSASLGVAREIIFRRIIAQETRGPFLVKTGIIRRDEPEIAVSNQCDLVVYNPHAGTPYYAIDDFVVVPSSIAPIVIEVKSALRADDVAEIADCLNNVERLNASALVFAYEGCTLEYFIDALLAKHSPEGFHLPKIIAVHRRNYIAIRGTKVIGSHGCPYYILNFEPLGEAHSADATAAFFRWYADLLDDEDTRSFADSSVEGWYDTIDIPDHLKFYICPDGTKQQGLPTRG
jgi:hypothetical protein